MKYIAFILCFLGASSLVFAQHDISRSVVASGGFTEQTAGNMSLGVSIGEPIVQGGLSGNYELTQGFQQGDLLTTAIDNIPNESKIAVKLYPVPTPGVLNIDFEELPTTDVQITVWSVDGRQLPLTINNVSSERQQINLSPYSNGIYMIRILETKTGHLKTYRVLKNSRN